MNRVLTVLVALVVSGVFVSQADAHWTNAMKTTVKQQIRYDAKWNKGYELGPAPRVTSMLRVSDWRRQDHSVTFVVYVKGGPNSCGRSIQYDVWMTTHSRDQLPGWIDRLAPITC